MFRETAPTRNPLSPLRLTGSAVWIPCWRCFDPLQGNEASGGGQAIPPGEIQGLHMKFVKTVLLGSAAGLMAAAGAQATHLPVKAKPVEYVKVCSLYGAGFWYVPGTDTCLKIGSYIREQTEWDANGGGIPIGFGSGNGAGRFDRTD